jgi:hypothetical protein
LIVTTGTLLYSTTKERFSVLVNSLIWGHLDVLPYCWQYGAQWEGTVMKGKRKVTWRLSKEIVKGLKHLAVDREVSEEEIAATAIRRYVAFVKKRQEKRGAP